MWSDFKVTNIKKIANYAQQRWTKLELSSNQFDKTSKNQKEFANVKTASLSLRRKQPENTVDTKYIIRLHTGC